MLSDVKKFGIAKAFKATLGDKLHDLYVKRFIILGQQNKAQGRGLNYYDFISLSASCFQPKS